MEWTVTQHQSVRDSLERQLSVFLRKKRGEMTYAEFSKKVGLPPSTLHRLEQCQQSITLRSLQQVMERLKSGLQDIFPSAGPGQGRL
jgi:predicted transcriptional regulator